MLHLPPASPPACPLAPHPPFPRRLANPPAHPVQQQCSTESIHGKQHVKAHPLSGCRANCQSSSWLAATRSVVDSGVTFDAFPGRVRRVRRLRGAAPLPPAAADPSGASIAARVPADAGGAAPSVAVSWGPGPSISVPAEGWPPGGASSATAACVKQPP